MRVKPSVKAWFSNSHRSGPMTGVRTGLNVTAFSDSGGFAPKLSQVIDLGPADPAAGDHLDLSMMGEWRGKIRSTPTP